MHSRHTTMGRRLGALVGPAIVGAFLLASCGGAESAATQSTLDLDATSTAFVVRPPATTEPPVDDVAAVNDAGLVDGIQDYTVQSGDYPFLLVERFAITLDDLLGVNDWTTADQFPGPGTVIKIPPGAKPVDAAVAATEPAPGAADDTTDATEGAAAADTIPDAGDNCAPGKYTIVANDFPIGVAKKFDVTVEALKAANASTSGYAAFYVGLEIVIPAKDGC